MSRVRRRRRRASPRGRAWLGEASLQNLTEFFGLLALAQMWNLLAGYAGLISIGQQAFIGIGAYALCMLADRAGIGPFWSIALAGLVAAALSLPPRRWRSACAAATSRSAPG